jgi:hypothetical protein
MNIGKVTLAATTLFLALSSLPRDVSAADITLLSEDFDSYIPGSNLVGQGGWTSAFIEDGSGPDMPVGPSLGLTGNGNVALGYVNNSGAGLQAVTNDFSQLLSLTGITKLSAEGFHYTPNPQLPGTPIITHNSQLWLTGNDPSQSPQFGWLMSDNPTCEGWQFSINLYCFVGARNQSVIAETIIDPALNVAYGRLINNSDNPGALIDETPQYAISDATISAITGVTIYQDWRRTGTQLGGDWDNILVTTSMESEPVPEPASLLGLAALGAVGFATRRKLVENA